MKIPTIALALALASGPALAQQAPVADVTQAEAGTYTLDKRHSRIIFAIRHLGFSTYYGMFTEPDGRLTFDPKAPDASLIELSIPMAGMVTADAELDGRLKSSQFFDAERYPVATFKATKIDVIDQASGRITGDLILHGVSKPVTLEATFNGGGISPVTKAYVLGFNAYGSLNRSDFGIDAYVPLVGDEVALTISGEFDKVK